MALTIKQQFDSYEQWILFWIISVLKMEEVPNSCFWAKKKVRIPENGVVISKLMVDSLGTYLQQQETVSGTTGDFDIYMTDVKDVSDFLIRIDAYGEEAFTNLLELKNSLEIWHDVLHEKGLGFQKITKPPKELAQFEDTDFIQQAQMDILFNVVIKNEYDLGAIETIKSGTFEVNSNGDTHEGELETN
jgi:hypothetical protein